MQTLLGIARSADIDLGGSNKPVPVVARRLPGRTLTREADAVRGPNMASAEDVRSRFFGMPQHRGKSERTVTRTWRLRDAHPEPSGKSNESCSQRPRGLRVLVYVY